MMGLEGETKESWERAFKDSSAEYGELLSKDLSALINRLEENSFRKVLDLGCGFGHWSILLAEEGFEVKAVDISSEAIAKLEKFSSSRGLDIDTEVMPAQDLDRIDQKFDCVISNSVLDHMTLEDSKEIVKKIIDKMVAGGIAFLSFDGEDEERDGYVTLEDGTRFYNEGFHRGKLWRYYSDGEIRDLLSDMEIMDFDVKETGKREVWVRKTV